MGDGEKAVPGTTLTNFTMTLKKAQGLGSDLWVTEAS